MNILTETSKEFESLINSQPIESDQFFSEDSNPKSHLSYELFKDVQAKFNGGSLVSGLLDKGAMSIIFGESNCGKTFWALNMALCIARGVDCFGRKVAKGAVLYIACEAGSSIKSRIVAYKKHFGLENENPPFAVITQSIDLFSEETLDAASIINGISLLEASTCQKVELVVIDTLARAMSGGDENSARDMARFIANIDKIRSEANTHVMVVHHSGKDTAKGARGHSSLRAAVDTEILIENQQMRVTKQRDMTPIEPVGFRLDSVEIGENENGEPVSSCVVSAREISYSPQKAKITEKATQALEVLKSLSGGGAKSVTVDVWRKRFRELHYADPETPASTISSAFNRGTEQLYALKLAETKDNLVWLTGFKQKVDYNA